MPLPNFIPMTSAVPAAFGSRRADIKHRGLKSSGAPCLAEKACLALDTHACWTQKNPSLAAG